MALLGCLLVMAVVTGWFLATSGPGGAPSLPGGAGAPSSTGAATPSPSISAVGAPKPAPPSGWVPPTGDPRQRYLEAKTSAERMQVISDFITLGHDHNVFMLQEAVKDNDPKVRMLALESAASMLTPELAREVYRVSGRSEDADIRSMTWSFLAPHPMDNRVAVYGEVIAAGQDVAVEEAISEMGRTPEMPLFEMMLGSSLNKDLPAGRTERLLKELNEWLKPGGGDVPEFKSVSQVREWWQANRQRYDQFMLRVDL